MTLDLSAVRATAGEIARRAGAELLRLYDQPHQEKVKGHATDIATEGDAASEAVVVAQLSAAFPDHHIISEESGGLGAPAERAAYFWQVDPLDGTSNFASNLPLFAVSLGLADRDGQPLLGAVYVPVTDELFTAARGQGATLNGRALRVSATADLGSAMLCTGFPYDSDRNPDNNLREWSHFLVKTRGLRRFGSIALELSYLAAGRFDGVWEQWLHTWDLLAGLVIVTEAGGQISDFQGERSSLLYGGRQLVASNGHLHAQMLAVLRAARAGQPVVT